MNAPSGDAAAQPHQPLAGLKVIELGHSVAAPFAAQVLADLGATVMKIEKPESGDDARAWGPPFWKGSSSTFQAVNRRKISLAVDLKSEQGIARVRELAGEADVVLQNMRPGLLTKLGLDAPTLRAANPRLIYCNLGAFGEPGPLADRSGYDPLIQAFSGIMSVTGEKGRPPVRVGPSIVDMGAGMWCVIGILSALMHRQASGQGCTVDASLYETALCWMTIPIANGLGSGREPGKSGSETPMLAPYKAYQSQDKHIIIAAGNDNLFGRLCVALGRPEWRSDARFVTNAVRIENRDVLNAMIEEIIATRPAAEWVETLSLVDVPCAPVQTVSEVVAHPQTKALGILGPTEDDSELALVGCPIRFDGQRPAIGTAAPALPPAAGKG